MPPDQSRAAFLAERRAGIGGSDIASVFSIGYGCRRRLWYDKRGVEPDYPRADTRQIELGRILEPVIAGWYTHETGRKLTALPMLQSQEHPELLVHIDRCVERNEQYGVAEIKAMGRAAFYQAKREGLPEDYILQLQHGILVSRLQFGTFILGCRDTGDIVYWDVERDERICGLIAEAGPRFWRDEIVGNTEPARLDITDGRCQKCEYRKTCQGELPAAEPARQVPELLPLLERYKVLDAQYSVRIGEGRDAWWGSQLDAEYEAVKDEIRQVMGNAEESIAGRAKVYYRWQEGRETWDMKALLTAYNTARTEGMPDASVFRSRGLPFRTLRIYL